MRTFVSSILLLCVLAFSGAGFLRAEEPPRSLQKGRVLILRNEYTIEGDIERVGERFCIRRTIGETWIPAERVLVLVASLPDAYAYLHRRINLGDPDERLRLARWCRNNGLQQQAMKELQAAAELRPDHAETRRLLLYWQQSSAKTITVSQRAGSGNDAKASNRKALGSVQESAADPQPIEVTTDSLGVFATKVQPILMNTCARCHATGHGGNFHLTQVFEDSFGSRRTLERNLAAVLAEVDVNQPETSRLLIKAVSDHAHTGQAPLRDRQSAPYRTLENWVKKTVADNPQLRGRAEVATIHAPTKNLETKDSPKSPFEEQRPRGGEESQWGAESRTPAAPAPAPVARGDKGKTVPPTSPTSGTGPTSVDPYDPEPFNRKMHPEANKTQPGK